MPENVRGYVQPLLTCTIYLSVMAVGALIVKAATTAKEKSAAKQKAADEAAAKQKAEGEAAAKQKAEEEEARARSESARRKREELEVEMGQLNLERSRALEEASAARVAQEEAVREWEALRVQLSSR